jgi:hypothetical protein
LCSHACSRARSRPWAAAVGIHELSLALLRFFCLKKSQCPRIFPI